jgi:hypothetical protein
MARAESRLSSTTRIVACDSRSSVPGGSVAISCQATRGWPAHDDDTPEGFSQSQPEVAEGGCITFVNGCSGTEPKVRRAFAISARGRTTRHALFHAVPRNGRSRCANAAGR